MASLSKLAVPKFLTFNTGVPSVDTVTDLATFWDLLQEGHVLWASLTLTWVFLPWLVKILIVLCSWIKAWWTEQAFPLGNNLKKTLMYFPMVGPLRMVWRGYQLYDNRREITWDEEEEQQRKTKLENIFKEASSLGFFG